jgi:hypothetical protein
LLTNESFAQTRQERIDAARTQLSALLPSYHDSSGITYRLIGNGDIVDIDSSISDPRIADGNVRDPYGTLHDCFLFFVNSISDEQHHSFGVFKNNVIVWIAEPVVGDYFASEFWGTLDVNMTGAVEILVSWLYGGKATSDAMMYVYSWDGTRGNCVSDRYDDGTSKLQGSVQGFRIVDINGDGVYEIVGSKEGPSVDSIGTTYQEVVYCWNGMRYGPWSNCSQIGNRLYTIANNLQVTLKVDVEKVGEAFQCHYTITNSETSKQKIQRFYIKEVADSIVRTAPRGWRVGQLKEWSLPLA